MKGREKEVNNQSQLIKVGLNQTQSTPNKREMNITSQEVNDIFLVIFELKENTNKKINKQNWTLNSIQNNFNESN